MKKRGISRREFLRTGAAATAAGLTVSRVSADVPPAPILRVLLRGPDGQPLPESQVKTIIACDMAGDPLPQTIKNIAGESQIVLASEPMQLGCRLAVPGFGEVVCYADNGGKGYTRPATIEFAVDAANTRLNRVRHALDHDGHAAKGDPEFERYMAAVRPIPASGGSEQVPSAYESLARGLLAGERLTIVSAQRRIARLAKPRHEFLFGGMVAGRDRAPDFAARFSALFNFATLSWYTWGPEEPESARIDYTRMENSLKWCEDLHLISKGFGYVYLTKGATPEWLRSWPYEKVLPEYKRVVEQTMRHFSGRMPFAEIINEAHDKSNLFRFDHGQILELTRESCRAARRGSPTVKRLINNCCMWGEYAKGRNKDGSRKWTPWRYIADCIRAKTEFERIGLQLYYPAQDLFEIERILDRFKTFGRPLHISEISCNSASGLDPDSMRPKDFVAGWHGPWTETMQADWAESIYTICYSKPEFEAVGWWDIADYAGHFWPFGGLFRKDFTPKESYNRLLELKRSWGLAT